MSDRKTKTFQVPEGIIGHGTVHHEVTFREPRMSDYMALGDIQAVGYTAEGRPFVMPNHDKVGEYLQRLIVGPPDYLTVEGQASLALGLELKDWVSGFFRRGGARSEPSTTSPATSSSNAGSTPAP